MGRAGGVLAIALAALAVAVPCAAAATGPALAVDATAGRHAISPGIYGMNFADGALARSLELPVDRWGGNTTDAYNWKLHSANTGNDYFFENVADCWDAAHSWCANGDVNGYADFVAKDRAAGAKTLMTLPMMGYVAKDAKKAHPFSCGFPKSVFATQDAFDPYDTNCGNGVRGGTQLGSDPTRDGTAITPAFDADWIADLKARYGDAKHGGVAYYELGNEPNLWNSTHRDMHPAATTYDELWQKSRDLAAAVKTADPTAKVLGFSEWGWPNYFCSAADHVDQGCFASSPDRAAHGGTPLVAWLLQQMRAYQQAHGTRLMDYLDLHYYAQGGTTTDVTRSLWDPTYTDPSWINDKIDLLPRMKQWVADDYPGTKLALSEYNLSVADPTTNALIQADTLGIFAREGLDLATRWAMPNDGDKIADAFRMFRNYNGKGDVFGSTYVRSTSADQGRLAVYGAERPGDKTYTILVINKTGSDLVSPMTLTGITPVRAAHVWRWRGNGIADGGTRSVAGGSFSATYPAKSMTMFVVPTARG